MGRSSGSLVGLFYAEAEREKQGDNEKFGDGFVIPSSAYSVLVSSKLVSFFVSVLIMVDNHISLLFNNRCFG